MKFLKRSLTGKYNYFQDEQSNIRLIRCDYNPNQPRDAHGRWTSGGGGGGGGKKGGKKSGGGGGLLTQKVSELQKQAEELGIDINTLSHKARKSVLASAIEAKQKGKDLREAGVLKATKAKKPPRQPKPKVSEPAKPQRMTGGNAIAVTDKKEFKKLAEQWDEFPKSPTYHKLQNSLSLTNQLDQEIGFAKGRNLPYFRRPMTFPLDKNSLQDSIEYHRKQGTLKESGGWLTNSINGDKLAKVKQNKKGEYIVEGAQYGGGRIIENQKFATLQEAKNYAEGKSLQHIATNYLPLENASRIREKLSSEPRKELESKGLKDFSPNTITRLLDNSYVTAALREDLKDSKNKLIAVTDKSGNLQSAVSYTPRTNHLYVNYLASSPWNVGKMENNKTVSGAGARAIAEAVKESQKQGKEGRLKLEALDEAIPFYEKLGFKADNHGYFNLSPENAKKILEKYG